MGPHQVWTPAALDRIWLIRAPRTIPETVAGGAAAVVVDLELELELEVVAVVVQMALHASLVSPLSGALYSRLLLPSYSSPSTCRLYNMNPDVSRDCSVPANFYLLAPSIVIWRGSGRVIVSIIECRRPATQDKPPQDVAITFSGKVGSSQMIHHQMSSLPSSSASIVNLTFLTFSLLSGQREHLQRRKDTGQRRHETDRIYGSVSRGFWKREVLWRSWLSRPLHIT